MSHPVVTAAAALAGIAGLGLLLWQVRNVRRELRTHFEQPHVATARVLAAELASRFDAAKRDATTVVELVRGAGARQVDADVLAHAAFDAITRVVAHYRLVALFRRGEPAIHVADPSEQAHATREMLDWATEVAAAARGHQPNLAGPWECADGRQFFAYVRAEGDEAVVLLSDARTFLSAVVTPHPNVRYAVMDPTGALWTGCAVSRCRALAPSQWRALDGVDGAAAMLGGASGISWRASSLATALGLPPGPAFLSWNSAIEPNGDVWRVTVVAPTAALHASERRLTALLLGGAAALGACIGLLVVLLLRRVRGSG